MNGLQGNIWGYIFGGQVIKNIDDLIRGNHDDGWDSISESERVQFVNYICRAGAVAVLAGDYFSLDDIFADELPKLGREWASWKQLEGTQKYFENYIDPARAEINTAFNIIDQGASNQDAAISRLRLANFTYVSKTQVRTIINGTYYDPTTDTESETPTQGLTESNAGFSLAQITTWISDNKLIATGILAAVGVLGYLMFSGNSQQVVNQTPQPKKLQ